MRFPSAITKPLGKLCEAATDHPLSLKITDEMKSVREFGLRCLELGDDFYDFVWVEEGSRVGKRTPTWSEIAAPLDAYHAANLREALKLVPDTGDWYGSLCEACEIVLREHPMRPNLMAEQMREELARSAPPREPSYEALSQQVKVLEAHLAQAESQRNYYRRVLRAQWAPSSRE